MKKRILFTFLIIGTAGYISAQEISSELINPQYIETINMDKGYQNSHSCLRRNYIVNAGRYEVTLPSKPVSLSRLEKQENMMKKTEEPGGFSFGILIGSACSFIPETKQFAPLGFGLIYSYDAGFFITELRAETCHGGFGIFELDLNVIYPFFDERPQGPYITGGVGYAGIQYGKKVTYASDMKPGFYDVIENESASGMLFHVGGGYYFYRFSTASVRFGLRGFVGAFKTGPIGGNCIPTGLLMNCAFLFD